MTRTSFCIHGTSVPPCINAGSQLSIAIFCSTESSLHCTCFPGRKGDIKVTVDQVLLDPPWEHKEVFISSQWWGEKHPGAELRCALIPPRHFLNGIALVPPSYFLFQLMLGSKDSLWVFILVVFPMTLRLIIQEWCLEPFSVGFYPFHSNLGKWAPVYRICAPQNMPARDRIFFEKSLSVMFLFGYIYCFPKAFYHFVMQIDDFTSFQLRVFFAAHGFSFGCNLSDTSGVARWLTPSLMWPPHVWPLGSPGPQRWGHIKGGGVHLPFLLPLHHFNFSQKNCFFNEKKQQKMPASGWPKGEGEAPYLNELSTSTFFSRGLFHPKWDPSNLIHGRSASLPHLGADHEWFC